MYQAATLDKGCKDLFDRVTTAGNIMEHMDAQLNLLKEGSDIDKEVINEMLTELKGQLEVNKAHHVSLLQAPTSSKNCMDGVGKMEKDAEAKEKALDSQVAELVSWRNKLFP